MIPFTTYSNTHFTFWKLIGFLLKHPLSIQGHIHVEMIRNEAIVHGHALRFLLDHHNSTRRIFDMIVARAIRLPWNIGYFNRTVGEKVNLEGLKTLVMSSPYFILIVEVWTATFNIYESKLTSRFYLHINL